MRAIETNELKELVNEKGIQLAEALPSRYFEQGHLPEAINIPLEASDEVIQKVLPDVLQTIVTYCTGITCPNARKLAMRLEALGYSDVRVYEGGKEAWIKSGSKLVNSQDEVRL